MRIVTGTGGYTVAWYVAMFENLTKSVSHMVCLIGKFSRGAFEGQHFYEATRNGARTAIVFAHQSKMHIKEFSILILEYNSSLRAPWKRCAKIMNGHNCD